MIRDACRASPRRASPRTAGALSSNPAGRLGAPTARDVGDREVPVQIVTGSDHAGYRLKEHLKQVMNADGHTVDDIGTHSEESVDYPPISADVARADAAGRADRGIVLGGSGQGEQIAANKVRGVRAALCNDLFTARVSRSHNDANVLAMGGRIVADGLADEILRLWLATAFEGGPPRPRREQTAWNEPGEPRAGLFEPRA